MDISQYREHAFKVTDDNKLIDAYFTVFRQNKDNPGACHLSSSILYVILKELGYEATLCLGEVEIGSLRFDHSWVELNGKIYDSAISLGLENRKVSAPVFGDYFLDNIAKIENIIYGTQNHTLPDEPTKLILKKGFSHYMSAAPLRHGVWFLVKKACSDLRLRVSIEDLKEKYKNDQWIVKTPYKI